MTSGTIYAKDLESYIPVLDPRRLAKPAVIKGKNFLFDVDGPRSAFMTEFYNWFKYGVNDRRSWREFLVEGEYWYGTPTGIWRIMPVSFEPELLLDLTVAPLYKYWPWTYAKVAGLYYFAQRDQGLWQYDPTSGNFDKVNTPVGDTVRGICASYGRLICLSDTVVFYSALDDGTDFTPSTVTGAGAQALSILSRTAFRVDPVSDGVIVSTDRGFIKGEFVAAAYVFRWYVLSNLVRPFSPNGAVLIPDLGLVTLDTRGFTLTDGKVPQPWEPLHGEYFSKNYISRMDRRRFGCISLHFSYPAKMLTVSFAPDEREGTFVIAFVYLISSEKWSTFNRDHHAFFDVLDRPKNIPTGAYMAADGYVRKLTAHPDCEVLPVAPYSILDFVVRKFEEPRPRFEDGVWTAVTDLWWIDKDPTFLSQAVPNSGLYRYAGSNLTFSQIGFVGFALPTPIPPDPEWYVA